MTNYLLKLKDLKLANFSEKCQRWLLSFLKYLLEDPIDENKFTYKIILHRRTDIEKITYGKRFGGLIIPPKFAEKEEFTIITQQLENMRISNQESIIDQERFEEGRLFFKPFFFGWLITNFEDVKVTSIFSEMISQLFFEINHDINRFKTVVNNNSEKLSLRISHLKKIFPQDDLKCVLLWICLIFNKYIKHALADYSDTICDDTLKAFKHKDLKINDWTLGFFNSHVFKIAEAFIPLKYPKNSLPNNIQTILKQFQQSVEEPPFNWKKELDFKNFIDEKLTNYKNSLSLLKDNHELLEDIDTLNSMLIDCFDHYFNGKIYTAYKTFDSYISEKRNSINKLNPPFSSINFKVKNLYRARSKPSNGERISKSSDLWHVPFNSRQLVKSHRYSIFGNPCLYLGESIYNCWIELGTSKVKEMYFSRFEYRPYIEKMFDMTLTPSRVEELLTSPECQKYLTETEDGDEMVYKWLLNTLRWWPLIMVCSVERKFPKSEFRPEYIIPQFLMEFIAIHKTSYIGIKYLSTHHSLSKEISSQIKISSLEKIINYAMPATFSKSSNSNYDIDLMNKFPNTTPLCYENLEKMKPNLNFDHRARYPVNLFGVKHLPEYKYRMSIYGIIEDELKKIPTN
jgi:hypothetical protein